MVHKSDKSPPPTSLSSFSLVLWVKVSGSLAEGEYKACCVHETFLIGGWGWKRSGAESPTGNPSPAPIAIAPHASHARHDRSMARWISVARAKVGGHHSSPTPTRKVAPSSTCPFVRFEPGITLVSWWTCLSGTAKIRFW